MPDSAGRRVDLNRNGSITLKLTDSKGSAASGGEYWLFRVGDPVVRNHNLCFELTGDFVPTGVSLDDLSSSTAAEALATYAELHPERVCKAGRRTVRDGWCFPPFPVGYT